MTVSMKLLLILAGLGQLALAAGSLALPRILRWSDDTAKLRPLTRQVFWTYAAYIWVTNICFGLISTFAPEWLLDRSPLARVVTGYIAVYWGTRLLVQIFYFDRSEAPPGAIFKVGEVALVGVFFYLTAVYGYAALS
jgi:ABC-type amino acid transport system permease subunit